MYWKKMMIGKLSEPPLCASVPELTIYRSSEAVGAFWHVARWIPCSISPFLDLNAAMCAALPSDEP